VKIVVFFSVAIGTPIWSVFDHSDDQEHPAVRFKYKINNHKLVTDLQIITAQEVEDLICEFNVVMNDFFSLNAKAEQRDELPRMSP
jgi:hypothetical protein